MLMMKYTCILGAMINTINIKSGCSWFKTHNFTINPADIGKCLNIDIIGCIKPALTLVISTQ